MFDMFKKWMKTDDGKAALIARLALGIVIFPHGAQKVLGWFGGGGFSGTMDGMTAMGLPAAIVFLIIIGEFFGSLGLIAGFMTRFCAASLGLIMLGAVAMVHWANGFFMNWYGVNEGEGFEYHLLAIGLALILVLRGGGAYSVDGMLSE